MRRQGSAYFRKTIQEDKVSKNPEARVGTEGKRPCAGGLPGTVGKRRNNGKAEGTRGWLVHPAAASCLQIKGKERGRIWGLLRPEGKSYPYSEALSRVVTPSPEARHSGDSQESVPPARRSLPRPDIRDPVEHSPRSPQLNIPANSCRGPAPPGSAPTPSSLLRLPSADAATAAPRAAAPPRPGGERKATTLPGAVGLEQEFRWLRVEKRKSSARVSRAEGTAFPALPPGLCAQGSQVTASSLPRGRGTENIRTWHSCRFYSVRHREGNNTPKGSRALWELQSSSARPEKVEPLQGHPPDGIVGLQSFVSLELGEMADKRAGLSTLPQNRGRDHLGRGRSARYCGTVVLSPQHRLFIFISQSLERCLAHVVELQCFSLHLVQAQILVK